jgi:hypothetical protein
VPIYVLAAGLQTYWEGYGNKPNVSEGAADVDALISLQQLHVLDLYLYTLDRHARHLAGLTGLSTLQELRLEMVGDFLQDSLSLQDGLPQIPHLTKLLLYTKVGGAAFPQCNRRGTGCSRKPVAQHGARCISCG